MFESVGLRLAQAVDVVRIFEVHHRKQIVAGAVDVGDLRRDVQLGLQHFHPLVERNAGEAGVSIVYRNGLGFVAGSLRLVSSSRDRDD
jgi:hypothetical protein